MHVGGIRHRRAVASVRLTGAPGSHVTSIFERPEAVAGPAGRTDPAQPPGHAQAAGARRTPLLDTGTLLLDTQAAVALGYDGVLIERAQREAARSAGVDPAQARDLQRELLAALADVASLGDRRADRIGLEGWCLALHEIHDGAGGRCGGSLPWTRGRPMGGHASF